MNTQHPQEQAVTRGQKSTSCLSKHTPVLNCSETVVLWHSITGSCMLWLTFHTHAFITVSHVCLLITHQHVAAASFSLSRCWPRHCCFVVAQAAVPISTVAPAQAATIKTHSAPAEEASYSANARVHVHHVVTWRHLTLESMQVWAATATT